MIERLPADAVLPAAYNPRLADSARLARVELSLRKLGWLLPIYATETESGVLEILSGHQRHLVATERWGAKHVPVQRCPKFAEEDRRLVNIAFNRGTNDMGSSDTSKTISKTLEATNILKMAAEFPDIDPDSADAMPCMRIKRVAIADLLDSCTGRWVEHSVAVNKVLVRKDIRMPVVIAGRRVINGVGRIQCAGEAGETEIDAVEIPEDRAELATALMNLLSMDFTIHDRYADLLRYSNSRRKHSVDNLNRCMVYGLAPKAAAQEFDVQDPNHQRQWKVFYGKTVLDFGAGGGVDTKLMREMGVDATPFEPWSYPINGKEDLDDIDLAKSRENARHFLSRVRDTKWDSIFMASVLNSVPFDADRRHLVVLIAALAEPDTCVYPVAASYQDTHLRHVKGGDYVNECAAELIYFALDYEPRIVMTSFNSSAKTQRYFTAAEFYDLWFERFERVRTDALNGLCRGWVKTPRPLDWKRLEEAIRFEFDLPFPNGERLGLVDEAIDAFQARRRHFARAVVTPG